MCLVRLLHTSSCHRLSPYAIKSRMAPKKKKSNKKIAIRPKGPGRLYLEETYNFKDDELTEKFVVKKGHLLFHLVYNQFNKKQDYIVSGIPSISSR